MLEIDQKMSSDLRLRPVADVRRESSMAGYTADQVLRAPHRRAGQPARTTGAACEGRAAGDPPKSNSNRLT